MIHPMHIIAILSLLAGWHLDAIDARLIEENREALRSLNIPTEQPPIIDTDARGRPVIPHDDPMRMFPYMSTHPTNGRCLYQLTRVPT